MNQAFYVDFEFESLLEEHAELEDSLKHFKDFIETHLEKGDEKLITMSVKLMESVSNAYSKKKEKSLIDQAKFITDLFLKLRNRDL